MTPSVPPMSPVRRRRRLTREQRERQRPLFSIYCDADARLEELGVPVSAPIRQTTRLFAKSAAAYEATVTVVDVTVLASDLAALPGAL